MSNIDAICQEIYGATAELALRRAADWMNKMQNNNPRFNVLDVLVHSHDETGDWVITIYYQDRPF